MILYMYSDIFNKFKDLNVLIIGDVMLDTYTFGKVDRISPEAPIPILKLEKVENRLGGAANVAKNVSSLGAKSTLLSVIGNDKYGEQIIDICNSEKIDNFLIVDDSRKTTVKNRMISGTHHLLRLDTEDDFTINDLITKKILNYISVNITKFHVVIIEDYDKGLLHKYLIEEIIKLCNDNKIYTLVDPKKRNFPYYKNVTILKPNLKEFKEGFSYNENIEESSKKMIDSMNLKGTIITLSEDGIYINYKDITYTEKAHIKEIYDVSGAGDTVSAVAALCLPLNVDPVNLAIISNMAGGLVCQYSGVVSINKNKLLKALEAL